MSGRDNKLFTKAYYLKANTAFISVAAEINAYTLPCNLIWYILLTNNSMYVYINVLSIFELYIIWVVKVRECNRLKNIDKLVGWIVWKKCDTPIMQKGLDSMARMQSITVWSIFMSCTNVSELRLTSTMTNRGYKCARNASC